MNAHPRWKEIGRLAFEQEQREGWWIWASDGVLGFARPLLDSETVEQAIASFEAAGESVAECWIYLDGDRYSPAQVGDESVATRI